MTLQEYCCVNNQTSQIRVNKINRCTCRCTERKPWLAAYNMPRMQPCQCLHWLVSRIVFEIRRIRIQGTRNCSPQQNLVVVRQMTDSVNIAGSENGPDTVQNRMISSPCFHNAAGPFNLVTAVMGNPLLSQNSPTELIVADVIGEFLPSAKGMSRGPEADNRFSGLQPFGNVDRLLFIRERNRVAIIIKSAVCSASSPRRPC